jgi:hypothetical protein
LGSRRRPLKVSTRQDIMKDKTAFSHKAISRNTLSVTEKTGTSLHLLEKIPVRRIQIQELVIYDIREDELDTLVRLGRASDYQTHAVWSLSTALTLLSFLFVPSLPKILFAVFAHLTTLGFALGFVLLFIWFKERTSLTETVAKIKTRRSRNCVGTRQDRC